MFNASIMNDISTNKISIDNPFNFGKAYKKLNDNDVLIYDTNNEIVKSAMGGLFEVYRGINASYYNGNLDWFIDYYIHKDYNVTVDSEEEDDGDMIYYITISWKDANKDEI